MRYNRIQKVTLLGISLVFGTLQAQESDEVSQLKERIKTAQERLDKIEDELQEHRAEFTEGAEKVKLAEAVDKKIKDWLEKRNSILQTFDEKENAFKRAAVLAIAYRNQYQQQSDFTVGEKLGDVVLKSNRTLKEVVIKNIESDRLKISHSGGFSVFEFANMPVSLASRVSARPAATKIAIDPATLLAKRPDLVEIQKPNSKKDVAALSKQKADERRSKAKLKAENAAAKREQIRLEYEQDVKWRRVQRAKIIKLNDEIAELNRAIYVQEKAKRKHEKNLLQKRVRPAQATMDKALAPYGRKISHIRSVIKEKNKELDAVRAAKP